MNTTKTWSKSHTLLTPRSWSAMAVPWMDFGGNNDRLLMVGGRSEGCREGEEDFNEIITEEKPFWKQEVSTNFHQQV